MAQRDYNRYELLKQDNGNVIYPPFVRISESASDKYDNWNIGDSRLDKWSQRYYGNPFYDFLILYANPEYVNEYDIPDNSFIRIPFPLDNARRQYEEGLQKIKNA
jgi:hypothetical protein